MTGELCPDCGAQIPGGRGACQAMCDQILALAYTDLAYASVRDLAFDTYCMQHPDRYCISAKSYAAHLTRLCIGVEHDGRAQLYDKVQRWLSTNPELQKPAVLPDRGTLTITSAAHAVDGQQFRRLVQAWATDVWQAYACQHSQAHSWIQSALDR